MSLQMIGASRKQAGVDAVATENWQLGGTALAAATFLGRETGRINSPVARMRGAPERLKEHRTELISAMTGKIDVRRVPVPEDGWKTAWIRTLTLVKK